MCRAKTCRTCGKTTWAGCGMHISQVKANVPAGQWCDGHPRDEAPARAWRWPWQGRSTRS
ncbi:hypothetical protein ACT1U9_31980 [Streptomyces sp. BR1]|uniref:hypothetical protein n=1 Tax=Streptomyces sp. BR1 TaxID=1592323 RepID=UPI00402B807A